MQLKNLSLLLLLLLFRFYFVLGHEHLSLRANANDLKDNIPMEKVLPEQQQQHDVALNMLQAIHSERHHQVRNQLRHGQQQQYEMTSWELQELPMPQQQQNTAHHQHKSQLPQRQSPTRGDDIDYPSPATNADNRNSYQLVDEGAMNAREQKHRQQKEQREKIMLQQLKWQEKNKKKSRKMSRLNAIIANANANNDDADNNENNNNNNYARNHIPGILTEHKQKLLGTRIGVNDARRQKDEERARANKHWADVNCENSCHMPQKRYVVAGSDPSKTYTPHRTTVYLCAEDTGCCPSRTEICAPKRSEKLEMYFIVKGNKDKRSSVEVLSFVNHTECHCIERSNYNPDAGLSHNVGVQRAAILNCNCPAPFEKIFQDNGQCRCDCSSGNDGCEFLKSGREHFSLKNRRCIKQGQCKPPTCQYGEYIMRHGRCPNQQEQLPHHQQLSYNTLS